MSTLSDLQVIDFPGFPTAVVRGAGRPTAELTQFMDSAFGALGAAAGHGSLVPTGPAFSLYRGILEHGMGETVDLEVGFPVATALTGPFERGGVRVEPSELPARRLAVVKHTGSYDLLGQAWGEFVETLRAQGHELEDLCWEAYDTEPGPDVDPATLITGLAVPVGPRR